MPDLTDQITQAASEPQSATSDGQSATGQPLPDLIEADKYLAAKAAASGQNPKGGAKSGWGMLRPARAIPPGAV